MMKLSEKQRIFTKNVALLILKSYELGIELTLGEAYRTQSQVQLNYYGFDVHFDKNQGVLIATKRKPTSKTLNSYHPKRLAIDFNFFIDGKLTYTDPKLKELGDYWESLHPKNVWGGNWKFKDTPHFQMSE